jgi:very-short-patch-repair endonuclease
MSDKTTEFINKSTEIHGDKYDYSKVEYEHNLKEVIITCKEHGDFEQLPKTHKRGSGCRDCGLLKRANSKKSNTNEFIIKSKDIHGDKYDYSKVEYIKAVEKVIITCKEHGDFEQTPNGHLDGKGCRKCSTEINSDKQRKTTNQFITEAIQIHNDKYDYSKVVYIKTNEKVIIICKEHGDFLQTPNSHLSKESGCIKCAGCYKSNTEEFVKKSKEIHGDNYDYSKVEYKIVYEKVIITCKEHGDFEQTPNGHLNGLGCFKCGHKMFILSNNDFINRAKEIHGDKYDYSKVEYNKMNEKIIITCKEHGDFEQTPSNHITHKQGCPYCINKTEFILYDALEQIYPTLIYQFKQEWCKNIHCLPFDFCIPDHNIIIELDGRQHFIQVRNWISPEETFENDLFKEKCANEQGYSVIRILQEDVFNDKYDWKTELVNNIEKMKTDNIIQNIYMCKNNEYDNFKIE